MKNYGAGKLPRISSAVVLLVRSPVLPFLVFVLWKTARKTTKKKRIFYPHRTPKGKTLKKTRIGNPLARHRSPRPFGPGTPKESERVSCGLRPRGAPESPKSAPRSPKRVQKRRARRARETSVPGRGVPKTRTILTAERETRNSQEKNKERTDREGSFGFLGSVPVWQCDIVCCGVAQTVRQTLTDSDHYVGDTFSVTESE